MCTRRQVKIAIMMATLLGLASCGSPGRALVPEPAATASPPPQLRLLVSYSLPGDTYRALGLTGANKPNGLEYRFRQDVPATTPTFVARRLGDLQLHIAESTADGWLALYKGPIPQDWVNARYRIVMWAPNGERAWELDPAGYFSRTDHLEIQDIRYADGELYLNEACQTYARDAGGRCSALMRIDPVTGDVVWRTRDRISNNVFLLDGDHVVAGYGFTAEPDSLFLVARSTGTVVARHGLDSAHAYMELRDGALVVPTRYRVYEFSIER